MKAAYIESFGSIENIKVGEIPKPRPEENEVLIAVSYAGVNPVDWKIVEGMLKTRLPFKFPLILGWEASGKVEVVGSKVGDLKKGDEVYLYNRKPVMQWGSFAQYLTYPAENVALKPKNISMAEAAAIPLAGLTAWQALFEKADLKPRDRVLIHGGGGGVGGFAIEWAKVGQAHIITTVSRSKFDYVKELGAHEIIDYQSENFVEEIRKKHPEGLDVVFDTVGGETYKKSFEVLRPGGRIVSILEQPDDILQKQFDVTASYLFVEPSRKNLQDMAKLFEENKVKPPKIQEFSLDQAKNALEEIKKGHTAGKIVLRVMHSAA